MWNFLKWTVFAIFALGFGATLVLKIHQRIGVPDGPPAESSTNPWEAREALRQAIASTGRACSAVLKTSDRTKDGNTVWTIECPEAEYLISQDENGDTQITDTQITDWPSSKP